MRLFLLLGANLGDRFKTLEKAGGLLVESVGTLVNKSKLYETAPWGVTDQPPYLNQVLELQVTLIPDDVLDRTQAIEQALGRVRHERWGSRLIDVDLLYYDNLVCQTDRLTLPHPLLHERRFALIPLCDIAPDFMHPVHKKNNTQLLAECTDRGQISVITQPTD